LLRRVTGWTVADRLSEPPGGTSIHTTTKRVVEEVAVEADYFKSLEPK
jgi:hypothetical protein